MQCGLAKWYLSPLNPEVLEPEDWGGNSLWSHLPFPAQADRQTLRKGKNLLEHSLTPRKSLLMSNLLPFFLQYMLYPSLCDLTPAELGHKITGSLARVCLYSLGEAPRRRIFSRNKGQWVLVWVEG